jgi:hypothetical protein
MSPALRTRLDDCYRTRRALFIVATIVTFVYTAWSLGALGRAASTGGSVFLPLILSSFGAVGLFHSLRAFWPLRSLENAPMTRLFRERPNDVVAVHAETKAKTSRGHVIRQIVATLEDGSRCAVTLGAALPGFEEELLRLLLAEAPNARPTPPPAA